MTVKDIKKVGVIGGGLMGSQIALNAAMNGYNTWVTDSKPETVEWLKGWSKEYLDGRVAKGKLTQEQADAAQKCFHVGETLEEVCKDANLVIEAVFEQKELKEEILRAVDAVVSEDCLITTNSSYMVSSLFTHCVKNPSRLANLHYFSPVLVMKLVEIVKGPHVSEETAQTLYDFVKSVGKIPVILNKEIEGFLVNCFARPMGKIGVGLLADGIASFEDIDLAVENGLNWPMGPFRLLDFTGVDLGYQVAKNMVDNGGEYPGIEILERMVKEGKHGVKTGEGFYKYPKK